jgi:medium-chain acyl-[acyl-carrier-protein] hydrolase
MVAANAADQGFEGLYRIRFDEADGEGTLRPSGYVRYAQDLAWQHSEARGFDRAWYGERGIGWLVRWVQLEMIEPVQYGATVRVTTEVEGGRRSWARRHTEAHGEDGRLHAIVLTDWILMSDRGRPARVPDEIVRAFSGGAEVEAGRVVLDEPPPGAQMVELTVRPQDVDPMRHVNNAIYFDYVDEVLARIGVDGGTNRRCYRLEFLRPAMPDERLHATAWRDGAEIMLLLTGAAGDAVLRASVGLAA